MNTRAHTAGASNVQERLRVLLGRVTAACELPPFPAVANAALRLASDPEADTGHLVRVVESDAALALRVLRISRSVMYTRRQPPRSVREAILTIGYQALRKVLIVASARSVFARARALEAELWNHALLAGMAGRALAAATGKTDPDQAFLVGLLHDLGKVILELADPTGYPRMFRAGLKAGQRAAAREERATYGFDHAEVGACLVSRWELDPSLANAILLHHAESPGGLEAGSGLAAASDRTAHLLAAALESPADTAEQPAGGEGAADGEVGALAAVAEMDVPQFMELLDRVRETYEAEQALFS